MRGLFAALLLAACSQPTRGEIVAVVTIDWEGAYVSLDSLDAIDALRAAHRDVRVTHFVSAAYFTKAEPIDDIMATLREAVRPDDELAVHVHAWTSLARAAGVAPRESPSYLTGTDALTPFEGDRGLDVDLDAYTAPELRAIVRKTRDLLAAVGPVSTAFRAGGYLGTPRVLQAIRDEGFTIDSSAIDHRRVVRTATHAAFGERLAEIWPRVEATTQPFAIALRGSSLTELPIAAVVDHATPAELAGVFDHAAAIAADGRDAYVVLALHHESADEHAARLQAVLDARRGALTFATVTQAAMRAHAALD